MNSKDYIMTMDEKLEKIWDAVEKTRDTTTRIEIAMAQHCGQQDIHTRPPCEDMKTLSARVWAMTIAALTACAGAVWSLLRDRIH